MEITKEFIKQAIDYVRSELSEADLNLIQARIIKADEMHLMPDDCFDFSHVVDLMDEFGHDHDLEDGWWCDHIDINDILFEL